MGKRTQQNLVQGNILRTLISFAVPVLLALFCRPCTAPPI